MMQRQPEAINLLCYEIYQANRDRKIDKPTIAAAVQLILNQRNKRFETMLFSFSRAEEKVLINMAKEQAILQPQGKDFIAKVGLTARAVKINIDKLMNRGIIDFEESGYYLCDPLLSLYLRNFR